MCPPRVLFFVAISLIVSTDMSVAGDASPAAPGQPQGSFPVHEQFLDGDRDALTTAFGNARMAFLAVDLQTAAEQIRKSAKRLREAAETTTEESKEALNKSAHELESLASTVERKGAHTIDDVDQAFARAYYALAKRDYHVGRQMWRDGVHRQAGWRLRRAADNLERAIQSSGKQMSVAAHDAIRVSRQVSGRITEGTGYAVDEVGQAFEGLGKQVDYAGKVILPATRPEEATTVRAPAQ